MLALAFERTLSFTRNTLQRLRCSSEVENPVDLHFIALAGRDGAQIAVDLCPCGSGWGACCICGVALKEKVVVDLHLVVLAERTLYLWRSSEGEGSSRPAPRRPCGSEWIKYLGEYWTVAKPSSGMVSLHLVGFSNT